MYSTWVCRMMNWALIAVMTVQWDLIWNALVAFHIWIRTHLIRNGRSFCRDNSPGLLPDRIYIVIRSFLLLSFWQCSWVSASQLLASVVTERQSVCWTVRSSNPLLTLALEYPTLYCGENPYPKRLKTQLTAFECGKVLHGRVSSEESFPSSRLESEGPPRLGVYNTFTLLPALVSSCSS